MAGNLQYKPPASLNRVVKPQPGGLYKIYFVPVEDVLTLPTVDPATGTITSNITLKAGKSWFTAKVPVKRSHDEEQKEGDAGPYMEGRVTAVLPFESDANHLTIDRLKYHRYILIVERPNKTMRLVGNLDSPARFSHSYNSGSSQKDNSGSTVVFTCVTEDKAVLYKGIVAPIA